MTDAPSPPLPDTTAPLPESLTAALQPGEALLWWDRPDPAVYAAASNRRERGNALWLFVMFGAYVAIGHLPRVLSGRGTTEDFTIIAMFVVAGFAFVGLSFLVTRATRRERAAKVVYAITGARLLILGESVSPRNLAPFGPEGWQVVTDGEGRGSLIFGEETGGYDVNGRELIGFHGIRDVARVADLARRTVLSSPTAATG